jgi:phage terminase small subunit
MDEPLRNPRHERFTQLVASGMTTARAYVAAGFTGRGSAQSASRLAMRPDVAARIAELSNRASDAAMTRATVDREWVLSSLKTVAQRCLQAEPVRDSRGKETGVYRFQPAAANRSLELLSRALGMFRDESDHAFKWDGSLDKLTAEQLANLMRSLEAIAFGGDQAAIEKAKAEALEESGPGAVQ